MSAGGDRRAARSEINVTPLVDVVLVLLVIFLVTMPIIMRTETLEVPRRASDRESPPARVLTITQRADGMAVIGDGAGDDRTVAALEVPKAVRAALDGRDGERVVFVDFCEHVAWQDVVATMDRIRGVAAAPAHDDIKVALRRIEAPSDRDRGRPAACPERQPAGGP